MARSDGSVLPRPTAARPHEHIDRTRHVHVGVQARLAHRYAHVDLCGEVEYHLRALPAEQPVYELSVADVADDQGHSLLDRSVDVRVAPRGEVVRDHDLVPPLQEGVDDVGADESGAPRDQGPHPTIIPLRAVWPRERAGSLLAPTLYPRSARPPGERPNDPHARLVRSHEHRSRPRAPTAGGAARAGRPRGDPDRSPALTHGRAARRLGASPRRAGTLRWGTAGGQGAGGPGTRGGSGSLPARPRLRLRDRPRVDRAAGGVPRARNPQHHHARLRVGCAPASPQLQAGHARPRPRGDSDEPLGTLWGPFFEARPLRRAQGGVLPGRLRARSHFARRARYRSGAGAVRRADRPVLRPVLARLARRAAAARAEAPQ